MKLWIGEPAPAPDQHVAFRGAFTFDRPQTVELQSLGASWYTLWVDGDYLNDGPARYPESHVQYERQTSKLDAGKHVIAVHAQYFAIATRLLNDVPPFLEIAVVPEDAGTPLSIDWKCQHLTGYQAEARRINPELGWIDWCDTQAVPLDWEKPEFDDSAWATPVEVDPGLGPVEPASIGNVQVIEHVLTPIASGPLAERFGYLQDDIPARFFLRDQVCEDLPQSGVWRRYDLGRVRLGRPRLELTVPAGSIIQIAYSETLAHGRVQPYIT